MKEILWRAVARFCAKPAVADWLIARASKTPYTPIIKNGELYMDRTWLFNPYELSSSKKGWRRRLPSVRVHHIRLPDRDRHRHDHPWNARTLLLRGGYVEQREVRVELERLEAAPRIIEQRLEAGDTAAIKFGEYHAIDQVSEGGVWTLFITWKYQGTWGFNVDGKKVPWRTYLGLDK